MLAWITYVNDSLNERLDTLVIVPLAFVALLGFFVIATVALENPAGALAASHMADVAG